FNIGETTILNHNYKSKDQIVSFEFDNGTRRHKVITYDSAQRLYQSKRGGFLSGPEKEEEARLSSNAFKSGMVDSDNFVNRADEWYTNDIDLA
ncbi:hypothetical protein OFB78_29790, partial [Escherichia coli]|nr:hypothetical protein [Escherichia coli]